MKKPLRVLEELSERIDLPEEFLVNRLRLTVFGSKRALVENHRGILEYGSDRILIASMKEKLLIQGAELRLEAMSGSEILVCGKIQSVEWE